MLQKFGGRKFWQNSLQQKLANNILVNAQNQVEITKYSLVTHKIISIIMISHATSHVMYHGVQLFSVEAMVCMPTFSLPTHVLAEEIPDRRW